MYEVRLIYIKILNRFRCMVENFSIAQLTHIVFNKNTIKAAY